MDEKEHQKQLNIAKATLRRLERSYQDKSIDITQLNVGRKIYQDLLNYDPKKVIEKPVEVQKAPFEAPKAAIEQVTSYAPEVKVLLEKLIAERDQVSMKKGMLCNTLHTIQASENCPELVTSILQLRNAWKELNAKVKFVQQHGCLPEEPASPQEVKGLDESKLKSEYEVKELWALKEEIENCSSNLSKAKKRLSTSQDLSKQAHYQRKVVELEWKLSMMRTVYNSRK